MTPPELPPSHMSRREATPDDRGTTVGRHHLQVIPNLSSGAVAKAGEALGLDLTPDEVARFTRVIASTVDGLNQLGQYDSPPIYGGERRSWLPTPEENRFRAWARRTEIRSDVDSGPLQDMSIAFKDNILLAGVPLANGSTLLDGYLPGRDAAVVSRVLDAGATVTGKAVCEPMSLSGTGHTAATGPVLNPHDISRLSGGSSSGSAVLVASGSVDTSIGADNGGSVRIPASWCGVYGLKPTRGAVPYTGVFSVHPTLDHVGVFARTAGDIDLVFSAIVGADGLDSRQRGVVVEREPSFHTLGEPVIGILKEGFGWEGTSDPAVDFAVTTALEEVSSHVGRLTEVSVPLHRSARMLIGGIMAEIGHIMFAHTSFGPALPGDYHEEAVAQVAAAWRSDAASLPGPAKLALLTTTLLGATGIGGHHERSLRLVASLTEAYDQALLQCDVLALPTTPTTALPIPGADLPIDEELRLAWGQSVNTRSFNATGHPVITVPCGLVDGLPVGLSFVGRIGADATVIRAARLFEDVVGASPATPSG